MLKQISHRLLLAGVLIFIAATQVTAANRPAALTLTPQIGVMVFEGNQNLDPGLTGGLALGYNFDAHWGAEGVLTLTSADQSVGSGSVDITAGHFDLLYHFLPQERLVPYLSFALGGIQLEDDEDLLAGYGVGLKYALSEDLDARLDLKHLLDINYADSNKTHDYFNILVATAGVSFQFGGERLGVAAKDRDADGIVDAADRFSEPAGNAVIDEKTVLTNAGVDTVTGSQGSSSVPPTISVIEAPVSADPGLSVPLPVAGDLSEPARTFTLEYLTNEDKIRIDFTAVMQRLAAFIQANHGRRFVIEGNADSVGTDAYNMILSLRRAENIKTYLSEKMEISASLLTTRGFGENRPIADNGTKKGRQQNRRVVIVSLTQ